MMKWEISIPFIYIASISFFLVFGFYNIYMLDALVGLGINYEEGPLEWVQVTFLLAASFLCFLTYLKDKKKFYIFCMIIFTLVTLEEVSWGQLIFNFQSPTLFLKYNFQNETNLHNMYDYIVNEIYSSCPERILILCFNKPFPFLLLLKEFLIVFIFILGFLFLLLSNTSGFENLKYFKKIKEVSENKEYFIMGVLLYFLAFVESIELIEEIFEYFATLSFLVFGAINYKIKKGLNKC